MTSATVANRVRGFRMMEPFSSRTPGPPAGGLRPINTEGIRLWFAVLAVPDEAIARWHAAVRTFGCFRSMAGQEPKERSV